MKNYQFKQIVRRARWLLTIILLLTLGVGQLRAGYENLNSGNMHYTFNDATDRKYDYNKTDSDHGAVALGTLTGSFTITSVSFQFSDDWGSHGDNIPFLYMVYSYDNWTNRSNWNAGTYNYDWKSYWVYKNPWNYTIATSTGNSGNYSLKYYWELNWGNGTKKEINNNNATYEFTYTIMPPNVSDYTVTPSGSIHGDGSSGNPYIVIPGNDLTLTLSGATQAHSDANSVAHYSVDGSSYGTGNTTKVITNVTNTSSLSVTVYAKFYNSSADLNGEIKGKTIYYKADPHYNVTATYGAGGTSATPASATSTGQYEGRSISATAALGYYFTGWTVTSGSATFTDASSASTTVYPSANTTIRANFSPIWYLKGAFDSWSETHPISLASSTSGSVDLTTTTAKLTNQEFKIWNKQTNTYYQIANKAIDRAHPTPTESWTSGGTGNGMRFTSDIIATYTFAITYSSNIPSGISVTYPPAYTVTFGQGTGYGTAVTASATSAGGSFSSGDYVAAGEDVTFTQSAHDGYTFKGWYDASSGGTAVTGMGTSDNVLDAISANANVYAQYTVNTYKITFDPNGGSIATNGDTYEESSARKINATYDAAVSGTMPTAVKNGRHFVGWYTASGAGYPVIDEDGTWKQVAGYTDASKHWIRAENTTLYAHYMDPTFLSVDFSPKYAMPESDITATVSFSSAIGDPEGIYTLCCKLSTKSGTVLQAQPTITHDGVNPFVFTFTAPSSPGEYALQVKLFPGTDNVCGGNSPIATIEGGDLNYFDVEEMNPITITYECGGVELRESTTIYATWNNRATVTAPTIAGMKFDHWEYTNCTIEGGAAGRYNSAEATFYAFTAGSAKAVYTQGSLFFKDTKGWVVNPATDSVYIYFYSANKWTTNGSGSEGTGSNGAGFHSGPFGMSLLEGTDDVYYFDETKHGTIPTYAAVAFSKEKMKNYDYFAGETATTDPCHVVYVNAFDANKPMIVPLGNGALWNKKYARYYAHDLAPLLADWGYDLRGDDAIIGWSPATDADKHKFKAAKMGDLSFSTNIYFDNAYTEKEWKIYNGNKGYGRSDNQKLTASSPTSEVLTNYDPSGYNMKIQTNTPGEYTYTLTFGTECTDDDGATTYGGPAAANGLMKHMTVTITYPVVVGDFRLFYDDANHPGNVVKKRANGSDIVSMYVEQGHAADIKVQSCTSVSNSSVTWGTPAAASYADGVYSAFTTLLADNTNGGSGVYNFTIEQDANKVAKIVDVQKYTGRFYVRTNCVNSDKWNYKDSKDAHAMTYSDYSTTLTDKPYSHYYVKDIDGSGGKNVNIRFTVATDYSEAITDTVFNGDAAGAYKDMWGSETLTQKMNVRFTYNQKTNKIWRAYTEGPQLTGYMTLRANPSAASKPYIYKSNAGVIGAQQDTLKFVDMGNWVYQLDAFGDPGVYIKLTADIHNSAGTTITQYLKGIKKADVTVDADRAFNKDSAVLLIGGSGDAQHMRITYDFKTERMTTAWIPAGTVTSDLSIHADVMLIRREQEGASSIVIGTKAGSSAYATLSEVEKAYGVIEFRKSYINNISLSRFERNLYWISFPFDVKLSDVFGFGKYGEHWIIEYYDGKGRAQKGYWADSEPNWKYVSEEVKDEFTLNANEGYILALALSNMGNSSSIWTSGSESLSSVYLYFPSKDNIGNITNITSYEMPLDSAGYKCNITRDHRDVKDSYWHCIGVPSYGLNHLSGVSTSAPGNEENWSTPLPYVYKWDSIYNKLEIASSSTFTFQAMKSYLIQYANNKIVWANVTNKPKSVVSRERIEGEDADFYEWRLNLMKDNKRLDHTYIRLSEDENATEGYDFGNDLSKEFNSGANIFTYVDGVEVAGNVMPIVYGQTRTVPVGVKITEAGDYTFSMPEGTNGTGVVLIDNIAGTRTNLALEDYTVNLATGTYDGRFSLEISPIVQTPTDIEHTSSDSMDGVRKVMVDGVLYIVKDGVVFDACGNRVK